MDMWTIPPLVLDLGWDDIVDLLDVIAWPLVVAFAAWLLRKPLVDLLG
jgi:hypothetical protein